MEPQSSRTQDNHCGSCDAGHKLENKQCKVRAMIRLNSLRSLASFHLALTLALVPQAPTDAPTAATQVPSAAPTKPSFPPCIDPRPLTPQAPTNATAFTIKSGACAISTAAISGVQRSCVQSPGYKGTDYGNSHTCSISVSTAGQSV
jgi:hypothetical protein